LENDDLDSDAHRAAAGAGAVEINLTNNFRAAFKCEDPKSTKRYRQLD